jgi:hypothetical protein
LIFLFPLLQWRLNQMCQSFGFVCWCPRSGEGNVNNIPCGSGCSVWSTWKRTTSLCFIWCLSTWIPT